MPNIENSDDVVGVCSECKSDQPDQYMERNTFAQAGLSVPCKYCGGVVIIVYREVRDQTLNNSDRARGIQ